MISLIKKPLPLLPLFVLWHCVPQRPYVATPYEPVTVKKKGDIQNSMGMRPFKHCSYEFTYAISDKLAIRAGVGAGGLGGLVNANAGVIYFRNTENISWFAASAVNYQRNLINRRIRSVFGNPDITYRYNCGYISPALVLGVRSANTSARVSHQFLMKGQFNYVTHYSYFFSKNSGSGKESGFVVSDEETLNHTIRPFFSVEPAYALLVKNENGSMIRYQLGLNFCEKVLIHNYGFYNEAYASNTFINATRLHPVSIPINFTIGYIFRSSH